MTEEMVEEMMIEMCFVTELCEERSLPIRIILPKNSLGFRKLDRVLDLAAVAGSCVVRHGYVW